ncbi:MAG: hypothetical protein J6B04_01390 [Clostridia bacterium]|nr:hypothetical protein [Clostridia bacterium]
MKLAAIDVGSNSVRLMVSVDGKTLYKRINTTRLGEGLAQSGILLPEAISRTVGAIEGYKAHALKAGCTKIYCFATAAVRSSQNGAEFVSEVKRVCDLDVDVLSGEDEAKIGLLGAVGTKDGGIIDVGGASTEIIMQRCGNRVFTKSLDVGVVRLYDIAGRDKDKLGEAVDQSLTALNNVKAEGKAIYAIGGTATTLASVKLGLPMYDPAKVHGTKLTVDEIKVLGEYILTLSVLDVKDLPGMDSRRADVIGGGCILLYKTMQKLGIDSVTVSENDNLEGYVLLKEGNL